MVFKNPWLLLLLPVIIAALWFVRQRQKIPSLRYPSVFFLRQLPETWKTRLHWLPLLLRMIGISLFCIALAGPRVVLKETIHQKEGIDIVLAIDASGSMAAEDFQIGGKRANRLEVVKQVVSDFINARQNDRMALVAFGGRAYTVSPLTTDYAWLKANLDRIELNLLEDGTAIGSALASSLSRLKKSQAKSKIIILLTDGMNNAGNVDPMAAAQAAKALGVKVYTIGAGTKGFAPFPVMDIWGRKVYRDVQIDVDEETLRSIAEVTGGQFFRATDTPSLRNIYSEIDTLEKTKIEEYGFQQIEELFGFFLVTGIAFVLMEMVMSNTWFRRIP